MDDRETYQRYLCGREWALLKEAVRKRCGGICERCKHFPMDHVHHLTYARKYHERLEDLQGLCRGCHEFTHGKSNWDPLKVPPLPLRTKGVVVSMPRPGPDLFLNCPSDLSRQPDYQINEDDFQTGGFVTHPQYGLGRVVGREPDLPSLVVRVEFRGCSGSKRFILCRSPLQPVKRPESM